MRRHWTVSRIFESLEVVGLEQPVAHWLLDRNCFFQQNQSWFCSLDTHIIRLAIFIRLSIEIPDLRMKNLFLPICNFRNLNTKVWTLP
jgi:hypothetical protein